MTRYKQPVSVLVVIYTAPSSFDTSGKLGTGPDVLLLERADHPGYWQSVTGSREAGEALRDTAIREVREETGLDVVSNAGQYTLTDWQIQNVYEIYPHWRFRYSPDVTHNTEHVFGLQLPQPVAVQLDPREHLNFQWLAWQDAAQKAFSPSNRAAILQLAQRGCCNRETGE
ncbi:MAG: dihydroneopterin triphosphate diphosphatase [Gallionellales bacterium RIFCSPLOWO2_02_FULL_57_47]|nr:MAG: dihydroneopterin triphosphate diphosphatase [Gallionellales bacterium RIFCSPLOWO2_02_FULL_57_47]OGT08458.1 MAG: dihydroneopterin triphosphate diphosphatase [Gallionellales bacterium RIFCSPHIGHO2_02_FULL_57_16]